MKDQRTIGVSQGIHKVTRAALMVLLRLHLYAVGHTKVASLSGETAQACANRTDIARRTCSHSSAITAGLQVWRRCTPHAARDAAC
jgi:hypothetical protein